MTVRSIFIKRYSLQEVASRIGINEEVLFHFIEKEWITPAEPDSRQMDDEDLARARLICILRDEFGVNEEAIPIILHLLDELHSIRTELKRRLVS